MSTHLARVFFSLAFTALSIGAPVDRIQSADTSLPPVKIVSGQAQFFVDDYLIASQDGLKRTLRQPVKDRGGNEPLLALGDEFGETKATLEANGTIVYDPRLKKWVMFALAFSSNWAGSSADRVRLYRFTSPDAMNWVKGDDGVSERIAIDLYDPQSRTSATNIDLFSCTYVATDTTNPYQGWLFFANWGQGREGTYFVQSPDGKQWKRGPLVLTAGSRTFEQDGRLMNGTGDVTTFYHDRLANRFLGSLRWASATDVENTNRLRARGFLFTDRLDRPLDLAQVTRLSLVPEGALRNGDMPTDEYYSSTAWRCGSLWLGGLRIWHSRDNYPYSASGCAFLKLVVSRDGLHWKKVPFPNDHGIPEVFLANGAEGGNGGRNDGGYMTEFSHDPLRIGNELIYYYGSSSWGKNHPRSYRVSGGGIFRARLRPEGFVSIDRGSLTTRKLEFSGKDLFVNGAGPIRIEVLKAADGSVLASALVHGDALQHKIVFDGRTLREVAADGTMQLRFTVDDGGALYAFTIDPAQAESGAESEPKLSRDEEGLTMKMESFDRDPGWLGVNNRAAATRDPIKIRQDFGYSEKSQRAGGHAGEVGGYVTPAGEPAFYGKALDSVTLDGALGASGRLTVGKGGTHVLLGFFNSRTVNEWRTPNTVALRLNGRGDKYFAYVEYCTSKWRAGGDSTPFPSVTDPRTGRWNLIGFPCDESVPWTLVYEPQANGGQGSITATIGKDKAVCNLDAGHKADGASFDRFGILNVLKSADSGSEVWIDDVAVNGSALEAFDRDPKWQGLNNRQQAETRLVRPWFDFGFSETSIAGGKGRGELGGLIFRGDCRDPKRMACYGDRLESLTLDRPLKASGKIAMTRGVSDSTTLFGFYHSRDSMRQNESQGDGVPESVLGIHIEGPSSQGFKFYPVVRAKAHGSTFGKYRDFPTIYPDRKTHDWSLEYKPQGAGGKGQVTVTLDGQTGVFELRAGDKDGGTFFDRFGVVTSWIDGNSQNVYLDDLSYTYAQ